jgi:hypothetical protein
LCELGIARFVIAEGLRAYLVTVEDFGSKCLEFEVVICAVTAPLEGQQLGEASDRRREMTVGAHLIGEVGV